jgi:hypothetical protein
MMPSNWTGDVGLTVLVSGASLLAVCVPFLRGLRVAAQALAATRRVDPGELERRLRGSGGARDTVAVQMLRVLAGALRENEGAAHQPTEFLVDASRQYVTHDWESTYARPLSMYANLLPPIGFIGTTGGLLILFLSMHMSNATLELGALALALTSSIFALIAFAILEGLKIRLYGRLLACLDDVLALQRATEESREAAGAAV